MKRYLRSVAVVIALLGLALVHGCGPTPEEKAAGTYALDKENIKQAAAAEAEKAPDEEKAQLEMALSMIDSMSMTLTLSADGSATSSMSMMGQTQSTTGTWKISGATVTLTMTEEGETPESVTGTLKGDTLELSPPEDSDMPFKMVFRKQK